MEGVLVHELRPGRYWLIVGRGTDRAGVFTVECAEGKETLPVFSFECEALLYLRLEGLATGWRIRETTIGELASMLLRPFAGVGRIALDPLPGILGRRTVGLVSLGREDFVRHLIGGQNPSYGPESRHAGRVDDRTYDNLFPPP